jgi:hypothetical protein
MHPLHRCKNRIAKMVRASALARGCSVAAAMLGLAGSAHAIDFGPFSLTGFAKVDVTRISSECPQKDCQVEKFASREFIWSDPLVQGVGYGAGTTHVTLFQPYLGAKFDLPRGFKLSGLVSQRWRDGKEDFKGFWYDKNIGISHEDYGSLRIGAMTTRAWSFADFPFGSDIGVGDEWASSGAGYGLLTRAARYTSRLFDVAEGDLVVEATYDIGKSGWKRNKPRFWELWLQYRRGDLGVDVMLQEGKNGPPVSFGHAPFSSLFYDSAFDQSLGGSSQSIAMIMARYRVDAKLELYGGLRGNRWSGAYAPAASTSGTTCSTSTGAMTSAAASTRATRPSRSMGCSARATRSMRSWRLTPGWFISAPRPPTTRRSGANRTGPRSTPSA